MGHKTIFDDVYNGATKSNLTRPNTRNWNINYPINVLTSDVISPLKDKEWKTINMECVSYFLLIQSKKIKRRIGYFYPNITLKKSFKTKKNRRNASINIIHSYKQILYDIHLFSHTVKNKICKMENVYSYITY